MATIGRLAHRPAMTIACLSTVVLGLGGCLTAGVAASDVSWYRYVLELRSGDLRYVEPLGPAVVEGRRYRVETDGRGRITRAVTFIGARPVAEVAYHFDGIGPWARGYDSRDADGEQTTSVRIHRDEQGRRTRQEFFLLDGRLTGYRLRMYQPGHVEGLRYTGAGKRESRAMLFYSAEDVLTRSRWYPGGESTYYDVVFDERTGLSKGRQKYRQGVLESSSRETYDSGGLPARSIHLDARGRQFGVTEFAEGLKMTAHLDLGDGSSLDVRFAYDSKRRTQEARYAYDGQPIFTLVYERLANGRVVRSVARGPDGAVWAEYPDVYVEYVEPTGEAVDRPGVAKIYRKGPWWPAPAGLRVDRVDRARPVAETVSARGPRPDPQCIRLSSYPAEPLMRSSLPGM